MVGMSLFLYAGRRIGKRQLARNRHGGPAGTSAVQAATSGLLALLLAFTVAGAAERFDVRRRPIVDEANAIGTAYLRLDLLSESTRHALQQQFRTYLDSRIETFLKMPDLPAARLELARSHALQRDIWRAAVAASRAEPSLTPSLLLLPALNQMIDLTTTRTYAKELHPPTTIFEMLVLVLLASALYTGHAMAKGNSHSLIHIVGFLLLNVFVLGVTFDLEYPRVGFIREESFDWALVDLRGTM